MGVCLLSVVCIRIASCFGQENQELVLGPPGTGFVKTRTRVRGDNSREYLAPIENRSRPRALADEAILHDKTSPYTTIKGSELGPCLTKPYWSPGYKFVKTVIDWGNPLFNTQEEVLCISFSYLSELTPQ